ncbi:MAG: DUF192 domain-containing protein [Schwartzia succinivorans]|nr:DUF192 domain-containing protein [Schwartzia succinivorans]
MHIEIADTFWRRLLGLMGRKNVAPSHALLLRPCSSVHMCFMRFSIDVAFVKRQEDGEGWQVVKVARGLRPWTGLGVCTEADAVLEMGMGEAERIGMEPGTVWEEVRMEAEKYVNTSPPL